MKLSNQILGNLPKDIERPRYDRGALTAGIVHIGLGNFHRAHQAWYLHRLMQGGEALDWAIIGAGVREGDAAQRTRLADQDYLTTLIELDPNGRSAEVIGSMIGFVPVEENNAALIAQMADPSIRIVSLTVTEGGYYVDPVSKKFDAAHPDILHDAANPDAPRTAFGAMISALKKRRQDGNGPFTGQSCDNLQGNGEILRQTVTSLARLSDPELAKWIETNCTFPNSMVDCIVPATGPSELELARSLGIQDSAPVTHENFRQWVIEDKFCAGRPDWDKVGAIFTPDVHTYEAMKIRILNGGHQLLANAGEILSLDYISSCMEHPLVGKFFRKVARDEIAAHVEPVPGMQPDAYIDLIDQRFANPEIVDTVRRVAFDGSSRHPGFLIPTLTAALETGTPVDGLILAQALWARMCAGTRDDGTTIEANDPFWDALKEVAIAARSNPQAWLNQSEIYGDLAQNETLRAGFQRWHKLVWTEGTEKTLKTYIED